jgi:hypothetical protein
MNMERDSHGDWVPLPGFAESAAAGEQAAAPDDPAPAGHTGSARDVGIRHVRRMSNWTAAALIVGAGATTVALAHHAVPVAAPAAGAVSATGAGTTTATQGAGPQVSHTVATTSASGVTTTTVTKVVNGKTVVSHVKHVPAYIDN